MKQAKSENAVGTSPREFGRVGKAPALKHIFVLPVLVCVENGTEERGAGKAARAGESAGGRAREGHKITQVRN